MSRILDIELQSLYQDRDKVEKENKKLKQELENYKQEVPKCALDKYTIENIEGIYRFKDDKGNIINGIDIRNLIKENNSGIESFIEVQNFNKVYKKVDNYNTCYMKILKNEDKIKDINKAIECRKKKLGI